LDNAIQLALSDLNVPNAFQKTRVILARVFVKLGEEEESFLSRNFLSAIETLGECICCDEKLFRFTGKSGFVRMVPNKPSRIGIWHYQATVTLRSGAQDLIYTKAHMSGSASETCTPTARIVSEWADISTRKSNGSAMLVFDSYYLSQDARLDTLESQVPYLCSVSPTRFEKVTKILKNSLLQSGDYVCPWNATTKEAFAAHWSMDTRIGKKFVLSNCFFMERRKKPQGRFPVWDEYKESFSGCDRFNKLLHKKTWPFRDGGGRDGAVFKNGWNYLFSCTLVNSWNLFNDCTNQENTYTEYCEKLAAQIVEFVMKTK